MPSDKSPLIRRIIKWWLPQVLYEYKKLVLSHHFYFFIVFLDNQFSNNYFLLWPAATLNVLNLFNFHHFLDEGLGDAIELRKYGEAGRDILDIIIT